jgi:hypothetical protein
MTDLILLFDVGHSAGFPWSDPAWGVENGMEGVGKRTLCTFVFFVSLWWIAIRKTQVVIEAA